MQFSYSFSKIATSIEKQDFLDKLFPNPWDALATFLAFIVLLVVVFFFAYKPVKKLIKKRQDYVEQNIKDSEQAKKDADKLLNDANAEIINKKKEALQIVEQAKVDAKKQKDFILEEAKQEKEREIEKAREQINQEVEASKDEIHREIVSVALDASKKVLQREVNQKDNETLINDFIDELDKGK